MSYFTVKTLKEFKTQHNTVITTNCVIDARSKALDGIKNVVSSAVNFGDFVLTKSERKG